MAELKFNIQNFQTALFVDNFAFGNKLNIAYKINEAADNLFDGEPTLLDLPLDAPPEFPRIMLKDKESFFQLNFSPTRIDFFYNEKGKPEKPIDSIKEDYLRYYFKIVEFVKKEYRLNIYRIAIVLKVISEIDSSSNLFIRDVFLGGNQFFKDTSVLEIHALEKRNVGGFDVNRWLRIKTAREKKTLNDNLLFVEIDINTLPDKPRDFIIEEIRDFNDKSILYAKETFKRCFGVSL